MDQHDKPSMESHVTSQRCCQVQGCQYDLSSPETGHYNYRKRICPDHMQALVVRCARYDGGPALPQRYCQQCGRLQPLKDFQGEKRSCQPSLNRRRSHMHSILAAAKANPTFSQIAATISSTGAAAEGATSTGKQRKGSKKASECPVSADTHHRQQQQQEEEKEGDGEGKLAKEQQTVDATDDAGPPAPDHKISRRRRKAPRSRLHPYATPATACNDQEPLDDLAPVDPDVTAAAAAVGQQSPAADLHSRQRITSTACSSGAAAQQPAPGALSMRPELVTPVRGAGSMLGPATAGEASAAAAAAAGTAAQNSYLSTTAAAAAAAAGNAAQNSYPAATAAAAATGGTVLGQQQQPATCQWHLPPPASQIAAVPWCQQQQLLPALVPSLGGAAPAAAAALAPGYTSQPPQLSTAPQHMTDLAADGAPGLMPGPTTLPGYSGPSLRSHLSFSGPVPPQLSGSSLGSHQSFTGPMPHQQQQVPSCKLDQAQHLAQLPAVTASMQPPPPAAAAEGAGFNPPDQQISNATMTYLVNQLVAEMEANASDGDVSVSDMPSDTVQNQNTGLMVEVEMQRELALQQQQQSQQLGGLASMYSAADAAAASVAATAVNVNLDSNPQVAFSQQQQQQQSVAGGSSLPTISNTSRLLTALCGAANQGSQSKGNPAAFAAHASSTGALGSAAIDALGAGNWPGHGSILGQAAATPSTLPAAAAAALPQNRPITSQIKQPQHAADQLTTFTSLAPSAHAQHHHLMAQQQLMQAYVGQIDHSSGAWQANSTSSNTHDFQAAALSQLGQDLAVCVDQLQYLTGSMWDLLADLCY